MTLCRVAHTSHPHAIVNVSILEDERISWKAKGILLYALSRSRFPFNFSILKEISLEGRSSLTGDIKELQKFGYLEKRQLKINGLYGASEYLFYPTSKDSFDLEVAE